jgi:hypothetical protein
LAESPEEFVGTFVTQASLRATRQTASLLDVLVYRLAHDGFPGIEDLKHWEKEAGNLPLSCSVADPSAAGYPELEIETGVPILTLRPGSLTAAILKGRFKAVLFSITLFTGGGTTAFARAISTNTLRSVRDLIFRLADHAARNGAHNRTSDQQIFIARKVGFWLVLKGRYFANNPAVLNPH